LVLAIPKQVPILGAETRVSYRLGETEEQAVLGFVLESLIFGEGKQFAAL